MNLRRCKLSKKQQLRLLEFFVAAVTARSAADILDLQPNTAALFYRKLRHLSRTISKRFFLKKESLKLMKATLAVSAKGSEAVGQQARSPCLVSSNVEEKYIRKRSLMPKREPCCRSSSRLSNPILSCIRITSLAIMRSMSPISNIFGSIMSRASRISRTTSTALKISGTKPNGFYANTKYNGIPRKNSHLFLKECEFRFSYGSPKQQLQTLRKWCTL